MRTRHPRKKAAATTWCRAAADVLTLKTEGGGSGGGSKLSWDQSKWLAVVLAFLLASLTRGLLTLYSVIGQNALFLLPTLAACLSLRTCSCLFVFSPGTDKICILYA